jgi:small ligand-binding sensory domain FIST
MKGEMKRAARVGAWHDTDAGRAGREAARAALASAGADWKPGWALAFCGGRHQPDEFLAGLRAVLGQTPVYGGSTTGTITRASVGYTGYEGAVAVFEAGEPAPQAFVQDGLERDERAAGRRLGQRLAAAGATRRSVLLLYDSIRSAGPPPDLQVGSLLLDGVYDGLGDTDADLIGGGTVADYQFRDSYVFDGRGVARHAAVALRMPAAWDSHATIMHGCIPVSGFLEITRAEGARVCELDGHPALEVLLAMAGANSDPASLGLRVTLGRKHGDPYGADDESSFVNRLILGCDPADGSVTLFEADFRTGDHVQVMARDNRAMIASARRRTAELLASPGAAEGIFALYIDCAGRASIFCGAPEEEAAAMRDALGGDIPLLGFYSGVEIAPLMGRSRPLDWTGVLAIFSRNERDE